MNKIMRVLILIFLLPPWCEGLEKMMGGDPGWWHLLVIPAGMAVWQELGLWHRSDK